jgi:seryl-tRNA synthetase
MLDITFIRENLDLVKAGAKKKHIKVDLDALTIVDDKRRIAPRNREDAR